LLIYHHTTADFREIINQFHENFHTSQVDNVIFSYKIEILSNNKQNKNKQTNNKNKTNTKHKTKHNQQTQKHNTNPKQTTKQKHKTSVFV
jgi:hypothetical protein